MNSIPASQLVSVNPSVVGTGGNPLSLNAVFLSQNLSIPTGQVLPFPTAKSVSDFFGVGSVEANLAAIYFGGFINSTVKPSNLYFSKYAAAPVSAFLQGASTSGMTLAQLQALTGILTVTIDGVVKTSSAITLTAATSFSNAATIITAAFTGVTVTYNNQLNGFQINSTTTGTTSTISFGSGTIADGLLLSQAKGAVISQGEVADTPATAMNTVASATQNWVSFMTMWEPDLADKMNFATWASAQNQRFAYVAWDSDITATQSGNTTCFGVAVNTDQMDGVIPVYLDPNIAAFICGAIASVDYTQENGGITYAFKGQAGLSASVTNATIAANLIANGYNFYGSYATANQKFTFLQTGQISGVWKWIDAFIDQIYMNSQFQIGLMELLANINTLPYNQVGIDLQKGACLPVIKEALNNGTIPVGVALSDAQAAEVNAQAGLPIDQILTNVGWYLQILIPSAQVRGQRKSMPFKFWYVSRSSVQQINMASIAVQ